MLAALCSVATAVFLLVLGVPYWLPLAIWTGLVSQFIPTIGTYLAIVLPALIALAEQPRDALWVVIFGTLYQQIENYLLALHVTSRTVFIHPAVAFGAVIAGVALFEPLGGLVAIPVVAAIEAVVQTYWHRYELVDLGDDASLADVAGRRAVAALRAPGHPVGGAQVGTHQSTCRGLGPRWGLRCGCARRPPLPRLCPDAGRGAACSPSTAPSRHWPSMPVSGEAADGAAVHRGGGGPRAGAGRRLAAAAADHLAREVPFLAVFGVVGVALTQFLYYVAIGRMPVGIALVFEMTAPVFIALYVWLVRHEKVRSRLGRCCSLWNVLVAQVWQDGGSLTARHHRRAGGRALPGDLLPDGRARHRHPRPGDPHLLELRRRRRLLVGSRAVVAVRRRSAGRAGAGVDRVGAGAAVGPGRLDRPARRGGAVLAVDQRAVAPRADGHAGLVATIEPVFASVVAWLWLEQVLTGWQVTGGLVVLTGIVLAQPAPPRCPPRCPGQPISARGQSGHFGPGWSRDRVGTSGRRGRDTGPDTVIGTDFPYRRFP